MKRAQTLVLQYGVAAIASGIALMPWLLADYKVEPNPFPLFLAAVALSAWYGGFGPGLFSTLLGVIAGLLFYPNPHAPLTMHAPQHWLQFALFILIAQTIAWLQGAMRRTNDRLSDQLDFTSALTRNIAEGVCAFDGMGRVTFMNPSAEHFLGWKEAELEGKDIRVMLDAGGSLEGLEQSGQTQSPLKVLNSGQTLRVDEYTFIRKDGTRIPATFKASAILSQGKVTGGVLAFRDITEQKRVVEGLRETKETFRSLVETSPDGLIVTDPYGYILMANQRAAQLYGYENADELVGTNSIELVAPPDRVRAVHDKHRTVDMGAVRDVEYTCLKADGTEFLVEMSTSVIVDEQDQPVVLISAARDRTAHKRAESEARENEMTSAVQYAVTAVLAASSSPGDAIPKLLQTVCSNAGWDVGAFWGVSSQENVLRCRYMLHMTHLDIPEFGKLSRELAFVPGMDVPGRVWASGDPMWIEDVVVDPSFTRALAASKDGLHATFAIPIKINNEVTGIMEFYSRDVREENPALLATMMTISKTLGQFIRRKQAEEALEHRAFHDALTDLPNRLLFQERLQRAVLATWPANRPHAVLLLDLNGFKYVNDTYGHHHGDVLLKLVAVRLRHTVRESDTIARLGGDEFAILLPGTDERNATIVASKVATALSEPFLIEGQAFHIGASVGIALYPTQGEDTATLIQRADAAMYTAKRAGGGYQVYRPEPEPEEDEPQRAKR